MSKQRRSRRTFLGSVGATVALGLAGCSGDGGSGDTDGESDGGEGGTTSTTSGGGMADSMTIFHAGSLAPPFSEAEPGFEEEFGVDVNREPKGSVASTQKITQQGRTADVLGVSDFRLIRNRILPDYGSWYAIFTTNSMSIQYREDSPGADEISADNWWEILTRDDVTVGHADPAVDPGGYRAVMTQQLGKETLDGERLYDEATFEKMRENSTVPTGTETKLKGQLQSGALDYAFYYQSISSTADMPYVDLQPEVDLSKATSKYAEHYAKAEVETDSGTFTGAPIAYGLTVPDVAEAPGRGAQWIEYFATESGREILQNKGLVPVDPIVVPESGQDAVPDSVMDVASAKSTLGPLEL
ncbi:substrate-binding domain-containing protein [Haloarcula pellucida]|uniref:Tungstate ABC transporter substrate-binding protein WtpA n=1 Tax=Haloarcula pellucida TaxID=1427151 RepID=A0A830GT38_9EURY|nr:substrate-binding domain-containing protein [Halomicroarcula pellucida]MBX0350139.1 substrate-binding domain-containing protein [Halomicroarcula pellucida]GGO00585.1 tungstate ABC transporter substrate-binding protein WtpA [Halomicroarcula pellucida]